MPSARQGANEKALVATLKALEPIDDAHAAFVQACKSLAKAVDVAPGDDSMWREYRLALKNLREAVAADGSDDGEDDGFGDAVRTPLGNTKKS